MTLCIQCCWHLIGVTTMHDGGTDHEICCRCGEVRFIAWTMERDQTHGPFAPKTMKLYQPKEKT